MVTDLKRLLLVEDDPRDIELTLTALAENGLANEVMVVNDGDEALDYLHRRGKYRLRTNGNPAAILLDLKLPKIDGLGVLRQLRSDPTLQIIPVVMLTSSREEQDIIESYKLGVNGYVVKPIDFHEFVAAVKEVGLFWGVVNEAPPGTIGRKM